MGNCSVSVWLLCFLFVRDPATRGSVEMLLCACGMCVCETKDLCVPLCGCVW